MLQIHLDTVFHAPIISKILYALYAWDGFLTQVQKGIMLFFVECISIILSVNVSILILLWMTWIENF